ncbi:MAG: helix-turn-helix transcriptional regulator [Bacteroides sp.]|nr:helix-turn-helix transcriptional regulator [Bacteroides sp.]
MNIQEITDNDYKDFVCPACGIIDRFGDKWSLRILVLLDNHPVLRFNELQRQVTSISQKMLASTLKTLESHGLVNRNMYAEIPPRVGYSLTPLGRSLMEPLKGLINWTLDHAAEIIGYRDRASGQE